MHLSHFPFLIVRFKFFIVNPRSDFKYAVRERLRPMKSHAPWNPIFTGALVFSILFHLSMVTVFNIVIQFPRRDIDYFIFAIVDPRVQRTCGSALQERLEFPSREDALDRIAGESGRLDSSGLRSLRPPVKLPRLQFAEMDLLRAGAKDLQIRSKYRELFDDRPTDVWARFGRRLSSIGDALTRVALGAPPPAERSPLAVGAPAPGFEAYLEWMGEPRDRLPVSIGKVDALWGRRPSDLAEPMIFIFKVNREGRVVYVLPKTPEDEAGIVESAARALLKYRFPPIGDDGPPAQHGTLIIRATEAEA